VFTGSKSSGLAAERGFDICDGGFECEFAELTGPGSRSKRIAESLFQRSNNRLDNASGVVRVVV